MIADELIDPMLPALKPQDSVAKALDWMEEFRVGQLALVENGEYRGIIEENLMLDVDDGAIRLAEIQPTHAQVFALQHQHLLELVGIVQQQSLDVLPVLDENRQFTGTIPVNQLLRQLANSLGLQEKGAIVVLQIEHRDYSLTEISRLVESNDAKIISSYFADGSLDGEAPSTLTLKLNRREVTSVVATLERYGYDVITVYGSDPIENPDRERLDMLLKYLEF
ncbi:MAG: CBS domain-containing protein [Spirosomataceae bacterium]